MQAIERKNILLIVSGGIAAYKSLSLIRLLRKAGAQVTPILTKGGAQFVTPLSLGALAESHVYTDLWSLKDETEMGHIRLSRDADLIVVAPASANLMARMAHGLADDLASTALLAADKPVLLAPAMNAMMWQNPATQRNISQLRKDSVTIIGPESGEMACGESGLGRMVEPEEIFSEILKHFNKETASNHNMPLAGKKALVTSGPTYEPLDPVRFLGNRSSGKQGHAIACALRDLGAEVTLISGPVALPDPNGVKTVHVETAAEMLAASKQALPCDIAVCAAAVSDWTPGSPAAHKIKKQSGQKPPSLNFKETTDILATLSKSSPQRPALVVGFAAETQNLLEAARQKRDKKGCDWILANNVSPENNIFGGDFNTVHLIAGNNTADTPPWRGSKEEIAHRLGAEIARHFTAAKQQKKKSA